MVGLMCGASLKARVSSDDLSRHLSVEAVTDVVGQGRLGWFGHLERRDSSDWVSSCGDSEVVGAKCQGGSRKTWGDCVGGGGDLAWSGDGMGAGSGVIARIIIRGMMLIVSVTITP